MLFYLTLSEKIILKRASMNKKKITISDIARAAEVSTATVSYILNKRQSDFKISGETTMRVLNICQKFNYKQDQVAVLLANCRKNPVRLLVLSPWLYSQFSDFMAQLNIVMHRWESSGRITVTYGSHSEGELGKALRASVLKKYDAVLLLGTSANDDRWLVRNQEKLPNVILINRNIPGFCSIYGNDREAMESLCSCIDTAHYRHFVSFITVRNSYCERCRHQGFVNGVGGEVKSLTNEFDNAWERTRELLAEKSGAVLVFLPSYLLAARLLKSAIAAGVDVPGELGIVTYDQHSLLNDFITPELTTVDPRLDLISEAALEIACNFRNDRKVRCAVIPAEIKPGKTSQLRLQSV